MKNVSDRFELVGEREAQSLTIHPIKNHRPIMDLAATALLLVVSLSVLAFTGFGKQFHSDATAMTLVGFFMLGMALHLHSAWQRYQWTRLGSETLERKEGWVRYQKWQNDQTLLSEEIEVAEIDLIGWEYKKISRLFSSQSTDGVKRAPVIVRYQNKAIMIADDLSQEEGTKVIKFIREGVWR